MDAEAIGPGLPLTATGPANTDAAGRRDHGRARALPGTREVRARLARRVAKRIGTSRGAGLPPEIKKLTELHRATHPKADLALIGRAYVVADQMHSGQMRRSGDPYITHPLAVAEILAGIGVDTTTVVAALLHDTVEDTGYTLEAVRADFGPEVATLVDGVTKLDKMRFGDAAEAETLRKLIKALSKDYRVLVIKIADRLHNMRTLGFQGRNRQQRIATVTLEVLAPLAHRLGVSVIKRELEDIAFEVLYPEDYARIRKLADEFADDESSSASLDAVVASVRSGLAEAKIKGEVSVRTSHYFSIFRRGEERGRDPRDINDIVRVLILVNSVTDCYEALGVVHALWRPVAGRLRDFVATPKFNMYQSLHTSVMGPAGRPVDFQIRTAAMHRLAETGIVARPMGSGADGARLEGLAWLHSLLDWQADAPDPGEFLESLSSDLGADEVLVFTPMGDTLAMPALATPVDAAYAVHTKLGHGCIGARVNGRLVPLHTVLRNGDVVEILSSGLEDAAPSEHWLTFVKTSRARVKIRRQLAKQRRETTADEPAAPPAGPVAAVRPPRRSRSGILVASDGSDREIGPGPVQPSPQRAEQALRSRSARRAQGDPESGSFAGRAAVGEGREVPVRLARCCLPLPGDDVVGFSTHSRSVSIHRQECANVATAGEGRDRVEVASWTPPAGATFPVAIAVESFDRYGLLADITQVLCDSSAAVRAASTTTGRDRVAHARFTVEVSGHEQLSGLLAAVRAVEGVYDCFRADVTTN